MYWKTLPREERETWEAKAIVAQAEHRKRYPDWRFRPGANALAKLKIKDGGGTSNKRKPSQTKKTKDDAAGGKGKIKKEERCAKIANLLVEGKKGSDLADAVKAWEGDESRKAEKRNTKTVGSFQYPLATEPLLFEAVTGVPYYNRSLSPDEVAPVKNTVATMFKRSTAHFDGYDSGHTSPGTTSVSSNELGDPTELECLPPLLLPEMFAHPKPWFEVSLLCYSTSYL